MFKVQTRVEFDGAHFLLNSDTPCDVLHGHRWVVDVVLKSETLNKNGFVINFTILKKWLKEMVEPLDHNLVNYFMENTTAENLSFHFFCYLHKKLWRYNKQNNMNVEVEEVRIAETPNNIASFSCRDIDIRKERARRAAYRMWSDTKTRQNIMDGLKKANQDPILRKFRSDRIREKNPMSRRDVVDKMLRSLKKSQKTLPNNGEKMMIEFFKENDIDLTFCGDGSFILDGKLPDFVNYDKKVVVEYNGRFWHSKNEWNDAYDDSEERKVFFESRGYKFYVIWDDEFEEKKDIILEDLKKLLCE